MPSPQRCGRQVVRHAAFGLLLFAAPASHDSPSDESTTPSPLPPTGVSTTPPPLFGREPPTRHVAFVLFDFAPPLSHCSPLTASMTPLPHVSFDLQSPEHPSPFVLLPSSQTSPFVLSRIM